MGRSHSLRNTRSKTRPALRIAIHPHYNVLNDGEILFPGGYSGDLPEYAVLESLSSGVKVVVRVGRWLGNRDTHTPIMVTPATFSRLDSNSNSVTYQSAPMRASSRRQTRRHQILSQTVTMRPATRWDRWRYRI